MDETRSVTNRKIEDEALDRLVDHLRKTGSEIEIVARPDRDRHRRGRAVDAEVVVDGRLVGVEITQHIDGARDHVEIPRLQRVMESDLDAEVHRLGLGLVAIGFQFRALPPRAALRAAIPTLVAEIMAALPDLAPGARSEVAIHSTCSFVRNLRLTHYPDGGLGVVWAGGSDTWGGYVAAIASEFAAHLVETKADQGSAYEEVWVVVLSRTGSIEANDLEEAMAEVAAATPGNWRRMWVLGPNHEQPVEVHLPGR
jgi:hypothetical protein